jgi:predicted phosphodiesterase
MTVIERHQPARHRTIFLSDIHLGTRGCQAELLLDFLKRNESETLYLVGDIVDGWRLKRWWYWPQSHNDVVQKLLRKARKGTNVVYIPGNHDEAARQYCQLTFGDVRVEDEVIYETPEGRKLLIIHGDQFDGIVRYARWLAILGGVLGLVAAVALGLLIYRGALRVNLGSFFAWTGAALVVVAAGVFAYGIHELQAAGLLPFADAIAFDVSDAFPYDSVQYAVGHGILSLRTVPSWLEIVAWFGYLVPTMWLFFRTIRRPQMAAAHTPAPTTV